MRTAALVGTTDKRTEAGALGHAGTGAGWGRSGQRSGLVSGDRRSWGWHQAQCQAQEQAGAAGSEGQDWEQESQAEGQGKGGFAEPGGKEAGARQLVFRSGVKPALRNAAKQRN